MCARETSVYFTYAILLLPFKRSTDDLRCRRFLNSRFGSLLQHVRHRLRILVRVDLHDLAPPYADDVDAMIVVEGAVRQGGGPRPADDDDGVVGLALDPDVVHGQLEIGHEPAQAAQPAAERLAVVAISAEGVLPTEAMMDVRGTVLQQRLVILLIDPLENPPGEPLDDGVVHGRPPEWLGPDVGLRGV